MWDTLDFPQSKRDARQGKNPGSFPQTPNARKQRKWQIMPTALLLLTILQLFG